MPKKYDNCIKSVKRKIRNGKIPKTFKCDSKGRPNKRGKKRCKSNVFAICHNAR